MVQHNRLKGGRSRLVMDGAEVATHEASHDALPFRLSDVEIKPQFVDVHPIIADIRQELTFQWKLLRTQRRHFQRRKCENRWLRRFANCWKYGVLPDDSVHSLLGMVLVHVDPNVPDYANTDGYVDVDLGWIWNGPNLFPYQQQELPVWIRSL